MAYLLDALYLTPDRMVADILAIPHGAMLPNLSTGRVWAPQGGTWHNTGAPSLGQWNVYSQPQRSAWGNNLNRYYKGMGWHAGPHACGTPDGYAIKLGDWKADGVHASCWNSTRYGVETVGNFCSGGDDPKSGQGLASMKSTANIFAALCVRFGWEPRKAINFHRECEQDHHACPGNLVDDDFAWSLIEERLVEITKSPLHSDAIAAVKVLPAPSAPPGPPSDPIALAKWLQEFANAHGAHVAVDGDIEMGGETLKALAEILSKTDSASHPTWIS